MITCSCGSFLRPGAACPDCGATGAVPRSAAAVLLGLTLACSGDGKTSESGHTGSTPTHSSHSTTPEPDYGVAYLHSGEADADTDADTDADPHTGTATTGGTGAATHTGSVQVDYGVTSTN